MKVLILGADGFIGRHIAFCLRAEGVEVTASARRVGALKAMNFQTLAADLTDPKTHDPAFWRPYLRDGVHLVNAAGLLTGDEASFAAVHESAPIAAYGALDGGRLVLISSVGIDQPRTAFARWRRRADEMARPLPQVTILRPGLVLADTSYGGSSLVRAMAAMPFFTPVIGAGKQPFNPIHAEDLAQLVHHCLKAPPGPGPWDVGGPETVTQVGLITATRFWLGLPPRPTRHLPLPLARSLASIGDVLRLGPMSRTAVTQLEAGVLADPTPIITTTGFTPRGFSTFLNARPAGTQDLWQARLYLLKPLIRLALAIMWLASGLVGLTLPAREFLPLLTHAPFAPDTLILLGRAGGAIDLVLGLALLRNWRPKAFGWVQFCTVLGYSIGLTLLAPAEWLAPLGGLLKNLPVLALIAVHIALAEER